MTHRKKKDDDIEEEELEEDQPGIVQFESHPIPRSEGPIAERSEDSSYFDIV